MKHRSLSQPSLPSKTKIYRYMDFSRLVAIMQTRSLWFTRLSKFRDQDEGRVMDMRARLDAGETSFLVHSEDGKRAEYCSREEYKELILAIEDRARSACASCWNIDDQPSDLMWLGYAPHFGVALESTTGKLKKALGTVRTPKKIKCGEVMYEHDPDKELVFQKRARFKGEREYRALYWDPSLIDHEGFLIPVDLETLVTRIWISSHGSGSWMLEVVKDVLKQYGLPHVAVQVDH